MSDSDDNKSGSAAGARIKLVIVAVLLITAHSIMKSKGYDVTAPFINAFAHYFGSGPRPQRASQPETPPEEVVEALPDAEVMEHELMPALPDIPGVALHPFDYAQYRQQRNDGAEVAELLTSQLLIELSKSEAFDLLDRSSLPAMLAEKTQLLGESGLDTGAGTADKLPLSDFTLTGTLFSSQQGRSYSLKLIRNSTGQIVGVKRYAFDMQNVQAVAAQAVGFVTGLIDAVRAQDGIVGDNKIAFGHFANLNGERDLSQGREITEGLIDRFVNDSRFSVLARTQVFPLLFEENLRMLQYTDEYQASQRPHTDYLVYGKYRLGQGGGAKPITIYLYIDLVSYGRKLVVLHAADWSDAEQSIADAVHAYLPGRQQWPAEEDVEKSYQLLIEAIRARGLIKDKRLLDGERSLTTNDIHSFKNSWMAEKIPPALELIKQSLAIDPGNQYSKLALAMNLVYEGKQAEAETILQDVRKSGTPAAKIAFDYLEENRRKIAVNIGPDAFRGVVAPERESKVLPALINEGYIRDDAGPLQFYFENKLDFILNYTHTKILTDFTADESVAIFERLRSLVFGPGLYVKYSPPNPYRPDSINQMQRSWSQTASTRRYNAEATLQFDISAAMSGMHIITLTDIPSVAIYPEFGLESDARRTANLEMALDGFAAAAYLDPGYLDAMVLLGYGLCDKLIAHCPAGNTIHAWVVDHTRKASVHGRGGVTFGETADAEEKDKLIFLSADAIDRVADAGLTDIIRGDLMTEGYDVDKYEQKLQQVISEVGEPASDGDFERLVHAYAGMVKAQCMQITKWPRTLDDRKYSSAMEPLAMLAQKNEKAAALRGKLLQEIESGYPAAYPYLLIRMKEPVAPFVAKEQDTMVARVSSRSVIPHEIGDYMELALELFKRRLKSGDMESARRYIQYSADFYGVDAANAMAFAYFHRQVGDLAQSQRLLNEYGKNSFIISNFSLPQVNGTYRSEGLNDKGHIKFSNPAKPGIYFVYSAGDHYGGLGERFNKWDLFVDARSYRGAVNDKHRESFAFDDNGAVFGDQVWPDAPAGVKISDVELEFDMDSLPVIELEALTDEELALPENAIERLAGDDAFIDYHDKVAIKAYPYKRADGPLLDEYFPASLTQTRRLGVVKEEMFRKGYISVNGSALFEKRSLRTRIEADFPDYSETERYGIEAALNATRGLSGAGYVEMYEGAGGAWNMMATLTPDDAMAERKFGLAAAVYGDQSLICDYKDGMYNFKRVGGQWKQQYRLESRCNNLAMNERWAAVYEREKVLVYRYNNGMWQADQTLQPDNYLEEKSLRHNFEYFGKALAVHKDTIFVGNPYGGELNRGQLYIYSNREGGWKQTQKLQSYQKTSGFGSSIAVTDRYLFIGNPSDGEQDSPDGKIKSPTWRTGAVLIYQSTPSGWVLKAKLMVKGRPRLEEFGVNVLLKQDQGQHVVMKSQERMFHIDYAELIARLEQPAKAH